MRVPFILLLKNLAISNKRIAVHKLICKAYTPINIKLTIFHRISQVKMKKMLVPCTHLVHFSWQIVGVGMNNFLSTKTKVVCLINSCQLTNSSTLTMRTTTPTIMVSAKKIQSKITRSTSGTLKMLEDHKVSAGESLYPTSEVPRSQNFKIMEILSFHRGGPLYSNKVSSLSFRMKTS